MKKVIKIFQVLLGAAAMIMAALIATGRLVWRAIRNWWRNSSKRIRLSCSTLLILISVGLVAHTAYAIYKKVYGRDYWDKILSENIVLHSFYDDTWRVYDTNAGEYTTEKINWLSDVAEDDSLAVYAISQKRGYINVNTGRIIIDAEVNDYKKAWVFSEGLAAVIKDGKIGFINARNEVVIPFRFDYTDKCRMCNPSYVFQNGYCVMTDVNGKIGLIDKKGNWVVEPVYDEIWAPYNSGYRVIVKDYKYGILGVTGTIIYPAEYAYVSVISDGFVLTKDGRKWQVDFEGSVVQPFMFDNTYYLKYPVACNECGEIEFAFADYLKYEVNSCYGIMNRMTGEAITPAVYSDINMLSKDLFEVQEYDSNDWHLLDSKGAGVPK